MSPGLGPGPMVWEPSLGHLLHSRSLTVGPPRSHCFPRARPTPQKAAPGACTLQGPLDGVVEVQRGLSGETSAEVDVADARDPHRMAAAAVDLAQAQARVTGALDPHTPAPGVPTRPARTGPRSLPPRSPLLLLCLLPGQGSVTHLRTLKSFLQVLHKHPLTNPTTPLPLTAAKQNTPPLFLTLYFY